ncbi:MAG: polyprenyl synthetase family protein [Deltaproteobacteria bacterium]|nr:polyprenyl synthetase family protein [Deltaproteobacteria bacterium]MBW2385117.1 polyprenyl synthetase family protein [Deltaproteobacteria bacterium]MBW2695265.1 polyprenyl synthetase family protein [Deltaproteobacteria bacterium]
MPPPPSTPRRDEAFDLVFGRIAASLELVEHAMQEQLGSDADLISVLGEHVLSSGGKRLRPALLLQSAELCGYTGPRRIQIGAAIELLHTATLLHDDVVDLADLRRGRPSANAIWGNRRAVLSGDFFYARASSMVVEDGNTEIIEIFSSAIRRMAEGELLQLQRSFDTTVTEAHYYDVIDRKSAALLSSACEAGAILGGVTRGERRRVAAFGRELGLAFQLKDDALDYNTSASVLGKTQYADLREGKVTLPLLLTLKRATNAERERIAVVLKAMGRHGDELSAQADLPDLVPIADLISRYHGITDTLRRADDHVKRAGEAIAVFPDSPAKQALLAAAAFAVTRDR